MILVERVIELFLDLTGFWSVAVLGGDTGSDWSQSFILSLRKQQAEQCGLSRQHGEERERSSTLN